MPEEELQKLKNAEIGVLAQYFGVPKEMARLRLELLSVNK